MAEWGQREAKREAARRVRARRSRFSKPETLQRRIAEEARAAKGITRLVGWAHEKGFTVVFGPKKKDAIFYELGRITISSRNSLGSQLIGLIHECGHLLVTRDECYTRRFGRGWPHAERTAKRSRATLVHRIQILEEEIEAWNRGEALANELKIRVQPELWTQVRTICLRSYAVWASGRAPMGRVQ